MSKGKYYFHVREVLANVGTFETPDYKFVPSPYLSQARHPVVCKDCKVEQKVNKKFEVHARQNGSSRCIEHAAVLVVTHYEKKA